MGVVWNRIITDLSVPEAKSLYAAVGYTCSVWSELEGALCSLFEMLIDSPGLGVTLAFGSIISMDVRTTQLRAAMTPFFLSPQRNSGKTSAERKEDFDRFNKIIEEIEKANRRRNKIIHGRVTEIITNKGKPNERKRYRICPNSNEINETGKWLLGGKPSHSYALTEKEVLRWANQFGDLNAFIRRRIALHTSGQQTFFDKFLLQGLPAL